MSITPASLLEAAGRTLATPLFPDRDQPPFNRSTRDGFAVRAADGDAVRSIIGSIRAGEVWTGASLERGQAIEIMTGAPLPAGSDAVMMVEHVAATENHINPQAGRCVREFENVVPRGAEATPQEPVLPAGTLITAAEIALAASFGIGALSVFARPRVAILATGDELVELDEPAQPWQIRNSNSYALAAMVQAGGGEPLRLPIARDMPADLHARIAGARGGAGLLVLSGGVSMGRYDLVEQVLTELKAEFFFTGARIQPGKPVVFGRLPSTAEAPALPFFGLPGNPVSTQVTFLLFVAPLLRALCGRSEVAPRFVEARLSVEVRGGAQVTRFLPAILHSRDNEVQLRVVGWQGSGDLAANARANAYAVLPPETPGFKAGETVRVLLR